MLIKVNPNQNPIPIDVPGGGGGGSSFKVVSAVANYSAAYNDLVDGDPTAGAFTVALPAASAATTDNNAIIVKNESSAPHNIAVTPAGGDTIDQAAAGSVSLEAGQAVYLVSDGVSNWIIVSSRDFVIANYFPGADIGAKINAACGALPNGGTVRVLDGDYVQTTNVVVKAGITIMFGVGLISNSIPGDTTNPPWRMQDGSAMIGAPGWGTKIMAPICTIADPASVTVTDDASAADNAAVGNTNLLVQGIQFVRNPADTSVAENACVQFGNITNATVDNCFFNGCAGYGAYQASSSTEGHYAYNFTVKNSLFENIQTQHTGAINCVVFRIKNNTFNKTDTTNNFTVIDCESNTGNDILKDFEISGNIFNLDGSPIGTGACIQVIGGGNTPYGEKGRASYGIISDNVINTGSVDTSEFHQEGINLAVCDHVDVVNNNIQYTTIPIVLSDCNSCTVKDNHTGTSHSNDAWHILLGNCFNCVVEDNFCIETSGDHGHSTPNIEESGTSDYNTYIGNWIGFYPDTLPAPSTARYAKVTLIGAHSRVFDTVAGPSPTPVDAPLITTIAELRALYPPGARNAAAPAVVVLGGYAAQADGGWSVWKYDPTSVAVDNGITVVVPTFRTTPPDVGAWLRAPDQIKLTTTQRNALVLTAADAGLSIWNTTTNQLEVWDGAVWFAPLVFNTTTGDAQLLTGSLNFAGGAGFGVLSSYTGKGYTFNAAGQPAMKGPLVIGNFATVDRPLPTVGVGAQIYDTDLSLPLWSDGANWKDAAGTIR